MKINRLEMEWTDEGCVAVAEGFSGVLLTCPRCQAQLPRGEEHRCGDKTAPAIKMGKTLPRPRSAKAR